DHGHSRVREAVRLEDSFAAYELFRRGGHDAGLAIAASNRAGMVYRLPGAPPGGRRLPPRGGGEGGAPAPAVLPGGGGGAPAAGGEGGELGCAPGPDGWRTSGDEALLDYPDGRARVWAALRNPNAGDVIVSPAEGFEFVDLGGGHHAGGGSHGSLAACDS